MRLLLPLALAALVLGGCTQAQIDRAQALSDAADQKLAVAQQAADAAQKLAEATNSDKAKAAVDAAQAALVVAKEASDAGHLAVASAKASQAAGAGTFNVLVAAASALVPALGGLAAAVNAAIKSGQALRQTVAGIEEAKKTMSADQVTNLHGALAESQDDRVKAAVSLIKAKL